MTSTGQTPTVLKRYAYGYDQAGNRLFEQIDDGVTAWTYDQLNRLQLQAGGGVLQVEGLVNEPAHVRIQGQAAAVPAAGHFQGGLPVTPGTSVFTVEATDGSGNTATAQYEVDVTNAPKTFTYDANGNLTSDGTRDFEWDARNQLVAVTVGTHRSEFTYDGLQRRTQQVEKDNGVTVGDTRVVWCETAVCEERAADGTSITRQAFHLGESVGMEIRFITGDHLGSRREPTSTGAALLARYSIDPWGHRSTASGSDITSVGFTGHSLSSRDGQWMARFRLYDPQTARWVSLDPAGMIDGPNLYVYAGNNPVRNVDADGRDYRPYSAFVINCDSAPYVAFGDAGPSSLSQVLLLPSRLPGTPHCGMSMPWWDVDFICTADGWKKIQGPVVMMNGIARGLPGRVTDPLPGDVFPFPCEKSPCREE